MMGLLRPISQRRRLDVCFFSFFFFFFDHFKVKRNKLNHVTHPLHVITSLLSPVCRTSYVGLLVPPFVQYPPQKSLGVFNVKSK